MPTIERWAALCQRAGARERVAETFGILRGYYMEPHRAYHTLAHIDHCLRDYDEAAAAGASRDAIELAIWFHDAIYDTRRKDNEEQSAALAGALMRAMKVEDVLCERVPELILATRHVEPPQTPDCRLMVDVDLAILGAPRDVFDVYEQQIRREYDWVAEEQFIQGRMVFLRSMMERATIFNTPHFREKYEVRARENMTRAMERLECR